MSALVFETVEVRPLAGPDVPAPLDPVGDAHPRPRAAGAAPLGASDGTARLALAWHVHQSVRSLQPRVLDRIPPAGGGVICATVERWGQPAAMAAVGRGPWRQQWWLGPVAGTPRTVYLQTSAV
jgi:hypothetical protein